VDEVLVNREIKLLARAGNPIMLKPLLITTATLFSAMVVSLNTAQAANAATQSHPVQNGHQELIARGNKSSHLSAQKQSDINSIHQILTEVYRGLNNLDADAIVKYDAVNHPNSKIYLQRLFKQLKSMNVEISTEVKSIDLLELTKDYAVIRITQVGRFTSAKKSGGFTQDSTVKMVKHQGRWKIGVGQAIVKPFKEYS
jgi:archaellum component FlaF (FlaF/FlaG flagellin family)